MTGERISIYLLAGLVALIAFGYLMLAGELDRLRLDVDELKANAITPPKAEPLPRAGRTEVMELGSRCGVTLMPADPVSYVATNYPKREDEI